MKVMCLNHPEAISIPPPPDTLSSTKPVPDAKKTGERCSRAFWNARPANTLILAQ